MFEKIKNALYEWLTHEEPYPGIPLCDFERIMYEIRPCDVLLIEGRSRVSRVINQVTQSPWTHSCLYIGRLHDIDDEELRNKLKSQYHGDANTQLIIEGYLGKGTICENLETYRNYHIRICRPRGLSRKDAQKVMTYAINRIGAEYNVRQIYDMWRFLIPWTILPRRWRSTLFEGHQNQSAKTVCSSMIAEAFGEVDFPILPLVKQHEESGIELVHRNPSLIAPKDFDYSPYFEIIKYPFIGFSERGYYHDLPWNREGMMITEAPSQYSTEVNDNSIIRTEKPPKSTDENSKDNDSQSHDPSENNEEPSSNDNENQLDTKAKNPNKTKNATEQHSPDITTDSPTSTKKKKRKSEKKTFKDLLGNLPSKKLSEKFSTKKNNI